MPEESKSTALLVFLFILFIMLAIVIFAYLFTTSRDAANYTLTETRTNLECSGYSFRIVGGSLKYINNDTLVFIFDPTLGGSREKNNLIITINGEETETQKVDFTFKHKIRIKISQPETFQIYPKGCVNITRICNMELNQCE